MERIISFHRLKTILVIILIIGMPGIIMIPAHSADIPNYDINMDGYCNTLDLVQIANRIGETGTPGWIREDVDRNGIIQVMDLTLVSNHIGESGWSTKMSRIKKLSINYISTINNETNQAFIAEHFDMIDCARSHYSAAANIKALNPDILIVSYYDSILMQTYYGDWDYVNQFEDWFVHDKAGNRIQHAYFGGPYLMNPNSGWSDYYAQKSKDFIDTHPLCDGIFADDVAYDLQDAGYEWNVPYSEFEEVVLDNWSNWMLDHIDNLQNAIGSKIVIPNAWKYTEFCEQTTGFHFWEGFVHGRSHDVTSKGYGEWYTMYAIDKLNEQAKLGNTICVLSGTKNADSNPALAHKYMLFTLICFLFAVEEMDKSYYAWNFFNDDASRGWYEEMDYEFGEPLGDYYQIVSSVYARQFENATVVANISHSTTYNVTINGENFELQNRTAIIIPV